MTTNEVKKALYKDKPIAEVINREPGYLLYATKVKEESIYFNVPIGEAVNFGEKEPAQLLIRWLMTGSSKSIVSAQ